MTVRSCDGQVVFGQPLVPKADVRRYVLSSSTRKTILSSVIDSPITGRGKEALHASTDAYFDQVSSPLSGDNRPLFSAGVYRVQMPSQTAKACRPSSLVVDAKLLCKTLLTIPSIDLPQDKEPRSHRLADL